MAENILNPNDLNSIAQRLGKLTADSPRQWGTMNAHQMVCHCSDAVKMAIGELDIKPKGNFLTRTLLKRMMLGKTPMPKGKAPTAFELDQVKGSGTPPTELAADKQILLQAVQRFIGTPEPSLREHPIFGPLNKNEWGRIIYKHIDHHLRQFAV